jgi:alpha-L-rhamnosidase
VLFQDTSPSWLAQIAQGATTIWETWTGHDEAGNARESHNHYAFGSVARFLQENVAGLSPAAPGYREILFAPAITRRLESASIEIQTPYGPASSSWRRTGDEVRLDVLVPRGATGTVRFAGRIEHVGAGSHAFTADAQAAEVDRPMPGVTVSGR